MAIENRHMGVIGQSGSGKYELLNHIINQYNFVIIFDNEEEYIDIPTFRNFTELFELIEETKNNKSNKFIVRYVPSHKEPDINQLNNLCIFIWHNRNNFSKVNIRVKLVIPEIAEYAIPKTYKNWLPLRTIIKRGRKYGIDLIWDTQKLSELDNIIWGQTRFLFIFHVWGNDLKYVKDKTKITGIEDEIKNLEPYEFILYDTKKQTYSRHTKVDIEE